MLSPALTHQLANDHLAALGIAPTRTDACVPRATGSARRGLRSRRRAAKPIAPPSFNGTVRARDLRATRVTSR